MPDMDLSDIAFPLPLRRNISTAGRTYWLCLYVWMGIVGIELSDLMGCVGLL